jgi:phosphoribosylformylglycinamidine synthase subunit PurS
MRVRSHKKLRRILSAGSDEINTARRQGGLRTRRFAVIDWRMEGVMKARVTVTLKSGILDPQGKAIEGALKSLGVAGVASVRQGKVFDIEVADGDRAGVEARLKEAAEKLLANTVIENYRIEIGG